MQTRAVPVHLLISKHTSMLPLLKHRSVDRDMKGSSSVLELYVEGPEAMTEGSGHLALVLCIDIIQ